MAPKQTVKVSLTQGEKKKIKQDNKAKANPEKAAAKKIKADGKRERRWVICESNHLRESESMRIIYANPCNHSAF